MKKKQLLTVEEVAKALKISVRTIYSRCAPKSKDPFPIRVRRFGKLLRFELQDVNDYIDTL